MQHKISKVKVRFAPSPTGIPHIGNTRTAFFNYLFAKHHKGEFILRIEDTDQKRIVKEAEDAIYNILNWLGIRWDSEVLRQSDRLEIYNKYANELVDKKIAHIKDGAIWVKVAEDKNYSWADAVGDKNITFKGIDVDEFVIVKSDGYPTYHLANVIDDHLMGITHVIRGEEWISSTPKHIFLYESFGWSLPIFAHLPVILGADHTKLSKRHGAKSALDYRDEGVVKEAILNFMVLLGWNPGGDKEQMTLDEMIELFDLPGVNTASPIFDTKKLEWLNGVWIRTLNEEGKLKDRLEEFYKDNSAINKILSSDKSLELVNAASTRMRSLKDFTELTNFKNIQKYSIEEKKLAQELLSFLNTKLGESWKSEEILLAIKEFSKENKVSFKTIFYLLTGKEHGIGILELNEIYGKDFFINNLMRE